jgi:hypothetical protein
MEANVSDVAVAKRAHSPTELSLALTLALDKLEPTEKFLVDRVEYDLEGGRFTGNTEARLLEDVRDVQTTIKRALEALAHIVAVVEQVPDTTPRPRPAVLSILTSAGFKDAAAARRALRRVVARHWGVK